MVIDTATFDDKIAVPGDKARRVGVGTIVGFGSLGTAGLILFYPVTEDDPALREANHPAAIKSGGAHATS